MGEKISRYFVFIISAALITFFQNCSAPNSTETESSASIIARGNGDSYEGKLVLIAPVTVSPGKSYEVTVEGGVAPYRISSNSNHIQFVSLDHGRFNMIVSSEIEVGELLIDVQDKTGLSASRSITVLGINNWFFDEPQASVALPTGEVAFVHRNRQELVILDKKGRYQLEFQFSRNGERKIVALESDPQGDHLYYLDSNENALGILDRSLLKENKIDLSSGACEWVDRIGILGSEQWLLACRDRMSFVKINSDQTIEEIRLISDVRYDLTDFQLVGTEIKVATKQGYILTTTLSGELVSKIKIQMSDDEILRRNFSKAVFLEDGEFYFVDSMARFIIKFDRDGNILKRFGGRGNKPSQNSAISNIIRVDDKIMVTDPGSHRLNFYDLDGRYSHFFGYTNSFPGTFSYPTRLIYDQNNILYVFDRGNKRIQVFSEFNQLLKIHNAKDFGREISWSGAEGFSLGPNGEFVITDSSHNRILIHDPETMETQIIAPTGLNSPTQTLMRSNGELIVADGGNNRVVLIENGRIKKTVGYRAFNDDMGMINPFDIEFSGDKNSFYLIQRGLNRIQRFDFSFNLLQSFESGIGDAHVKQPLDISVSSKGNLVLADRFKNRVVVLDDRGNLIREYGNDESQPGLTLSGPRGVATAPDGRIAVSDTGNNRIQIFPNTD